jgi:hypothetical protein
VSSFLRAHETPRKCDALEQIQVREQAAHGNVGIGKALEQSENAE